MYCYTTVTLDPSDLVYYHIDMEVVRMYQAVAMTEGEALCILLLILIVLYVSVIQYAQSKLAPWEGSMHVYRIRVSSMVLCTIHQDKATGNIIQVVFMTDDGKGCPVSSCIGSIKGIATDVLRSASEERINLFDIWRASNPKACGTDGCIKPAPLDHPCPHEVKVNDNHTLCSCCTDCQSVCAQPNPTA